MTFLPSRGVLAALVGAASAAIACAGPASAESMPSQPSTLTQPAPPAPADSTSAGWLPPINFNVNLAGFDFKHTDLTPEWTTFDAGIWYVSPDLPVFSIGWLANLRLLAPDCATGSMTLYKKDGTSESMPLCSNVTLWTNLSSRPGRDYSMVCLAAAQPGDAGQRTCFRFVN